MNNKIIRLDKKLAENNELITDLSNLIYYFRHELAVLKNKNINYSKDNALEEIQEYLITPYELYFVTLNQKVIGYLVLKIFDDTVWIEQLFTHKDFRRKQTAKNLTDFATQRAKILGKNTAFVNVHPNNEKMLKFLASQGYTVLNLLEIRKAYTNEKIQTMISVQIKSTNQSFEFDY